MRPGHAADHSPPSSAAAMEEQSYTSAHPLGHTGAVTGKLYLLGTHIFPLFDFFLILHFLLVGL